MFSTRASTKLCRGFVREARTRRGDRQSGSRARDRHTGRAWGPPLSVPSKQWRTNVDIERQLTDLFRVGALPSRRRQGMATAAGLSLDRMRALGAEAEPATKRVTTASALFALCDMAKARMFRSTRVFALLERALAGRWLRLATERARYITGQARDLDERAAGETTVLSANAMQALLVAHLLAGEQAVARPLIVEDIVLGLLLCVPAADEPIAAHTVLRRLELAPLQLLQQWARLTTV